MKRLLDDYRFSDTLRFEGHRLCYTVGDEQYVVGGVLAAAMLSALLVDTAEGDERQIAIETPEQREEWFSRYEREVRREDGGLFENEVQSLAEAYANLSAVDDIYAMLGCKKRLVGLAFELTMEYMQRLVRELVHDQVYEACQWRSPFAQWLFDAGFVETWRQRLLAVDWEEPEDVYQFAESLQKPEPEAKATFVFDGLSAEALMNAYFDWLWSGMQQEAALFPDDAVRLAELKPLILERETNDDFIWPELKELPQADINLYKKWMVQWKAFIEDKIAPAPISKKKVHEEQEIFADDITPIPKANLYAATREYINDRCKYDKDFAQKFQNFSLAKFSRQLTFFFGWSVDPNSLRKSLDRKPKHPKK